MRIRITFAKTEAMRYTGHLDLQRAWERTFRRAGLPLAYSQGYNPRPRLNLASALPLGFTSQGEVLDARLERDLAIDKIMEPLLKALPPGLQILEIEEVDLRAPSPQVELQAAEFVITFLEPFPGLAERTDDILHAPTLMRERRNKTYDLRPLIQALHVLPNDEDGRQRLFTRLEARQGATGRPEEVIAALGADPQATRVQRTKLLTLSKR
jgi:radical SAM-linked protein